MPQNDHTALSEDMSLYILTKPLQQKIYLSS